ncbi:MAG: response regulator [OM182 bacterium]|jgi:DNA-binding response OmpR family regulator|nr:MAG: response regulator [OM182 bacterium]HBK17083.1 two-component system response regulator OmpR [Gammaproteobacteria bacterium]|tara:strand:- start:8052 stop:8837 length:786 start_codon:yes stop_codon:yes gene_type:complete
MSATDAASTNSEQLLLLDDDLEICHLTQAYLERQGYTVNCVHSAEEMDAFLAKNSVDLLILDLMLPGEQGLSVAQRLKKRENLPIIIVSAQGDEVDRIVGLELGADDYLPKPFNPRELLARIRAVLRRSSQTLAQDPDTQGVVNFGAFQLDLDSHRLTKAGAPIALTSGEFDLLAILVAHPNKVLHRDKILDLLTGAERSPFDRSIDVRITRVRSKLEDDPAKPKLIKTIWGKGYMFCPRIGEEQRTAGRHLSGSISEHEA